MPKKKKDSGKGPSPFDFAKFEGQQASAQAQQRKRRGWVDPERKIITPGEDGHVLRLVGQPHHVMEMWVECEDGQRRPIYMDSDHVLLRLYDRAMAGERQKVPGKDGKEKSVMVHDHEGTQIFETIDGGGDWNRAWTPRQVNLWNCIDRDDNWCKRNKHCKILTTTEKGKGFGPMIMGGRRGKGGIMLVVRQAKPAAPDEYDIKITRTGKKTDTEYAVTEPNAARDKRVKSGKLTAGEREYGLYDLQELVPVTPPEKVVAMLGETIRQADADLGTTFCKELGMRKAAARKGKAARK